MRRFYTAESVTEGHPDKVCDQIADAILDECLRYDPSSRVACEVLATRGNVFVAGEITSGYEPPVFDVIRKVLEECGYCTDGIEMEGDSYLKSSSNREFQGYPLTDNDVLLSNADVSGIFAGDGAALFDIYNRYVQAN